MADTLRSALLISAVGMGLVFGVILLLWGLIALVVRVGADRAVDQGSGGDAGNEEPVDAAGQAPADGQDPTALEVQAAAAAVGAYLAAERQGG